MSFTQLDVIDAHFCGVDSNAHARRKEDLLYTEWRGREWWEARMKMYIQTEAAEIDSKTYSTLTGVRHVHYTNWRGGERW